MPSKIKDLSQRRAKFAYEQVNQLKGKDWAEEFKSHVKEVPMMIKTSGLAAAYAFVFSKNKKEDYKKITAITQDWLVDRCQFFKMTNGGFHETLVNLERDEYRLAIREILALFTWLKRYADGMIQDK